MSLFGTGRREGILAVCLIGLIVALGHISAEMRHAAPDTLSCQTALMAAVGGMLTYRFLRSQGRSRYAGFLAGAAYGLSPIFAGLALAPREQFAAALAPLALEAVNHCHLASSRRRWLPWTGLCLSLPFAAGLTVVACITALLGLTGFVRTILFGDHSDERAPLRGMLLATAICGMAAVNCTLLQPLAAWLGPVTAPDAMQVLAGGDAPAALLTPTTILRALVPFLLWFTVLGVLRKQRHVGNVTWLGLALAGALPTVLVHALPGTSASHSMLSAMPTLPAAGWWLSLLAVAVLGAAGLDDFLDQPMRRRSAQYLLLAMTLATAAVLPLLEASAGPREQWIVLGTILLLAVAITTWRRLGILRFKNMLSTLVLAACALPVIAQAAPTLGWPAAPLDEIAAPVWQAMWLDASTRPWWHFAGITAGLVATIVLATRNLRHSARRSRAVAFNAGAAVRRPAACLPPRKRP